MVLACMLTYVAGGVCNCNYILSIKLFWRGDREATFRYRLGCYLSTCLTTHDGGFTLSLQWLNVKQEAVKTIKFYSLWFDPEVGVLQDSSQIAQVAQMRNLRCALCLFFSACAICVCESVNLIFVAL